MSLKSALIHLRMKQKGVGWYGNYQSWEDAMANSQGYNDDHVFQAIESAALKVLHEEAKYERDGTVFDKIEYNFPLVSSVLFAKCHVNSDQIHITDFGGSLGSVYFQHKNIWNYFPDLKWHIVEQEKLASVGKRTFSNKHLDFASSIDELNMSDNYKTDVLLLSSVLQYLPNPYEFLNAVESYKFKFLILDAMPLMNSSTDRLTVQKVRTPTYSTSYPCYLLSRKKLIEYLTKNFELVFELKPDLYIYVNGRKIDYEGFLFKRR